MGDLEQPSSLHSGSCSSPSTESIFQVASGDFENSPHTIQDCSDLSDDVVKAVNTIESSTGKFKFYKKEVVDISDSVNVLVDHIRDLSGMVHRLQSDLIDKEKILDVAMNSYFLNKLADFTESIVQEKISKLSSNVNKSIRSANSALPKNCVWPTLANQASGSVQQKVVQQKQTKAVEISPSVASGFKDSQQTLTFLKQKLSSKALADKNVSIQKKRLAKNGKVVIFCETEREMKAVNELLQDSAGTSVVLRDITRRPQLHVAGIPADVPKEELVGILKGSNAPLRDFLAANPNEDINLVFASRPVGARKYAILGASPKVFQFILENMSGRLSIHFDICNVTEHHQTIQCHKCLRFGHISSRCRMTCDVCFHCGGNHKFAQCSVRSSPPKCPNCAESNSKYNSGLPVDHKATNHRCCPTFINRINKIKETINYGC